MPPTTRRRELSQHVDLSEQHNGISHDDDFDPDQAALLQDLARNGAPESQTYGYPELGTNGGHMNGYNENASNGMHSNDVLPIDGYAYYADFTYPEAGLLQSQQDLDLDDPAALLESLANFEHPPSSSNHQFASLLQAAATATGEEAAQLDLGRTRKSARQSRHMEEPNIAQSYTPENRSRRRPSDRPDIMETHGFVTRGNKRKRVLDEADEEEQLRREREIWGPEEPEEEDPYQEPLYERSPVSTSEARAAGVHSAAALFRRPSSASKKYTRPPMSKLFTSLELTPEQFLHLQAAAKIYMLDPNYPERRDCVGNRGKSDTDMVKLKLFGCVKSFLEDEGWGERCFGANAEGAESRKLRWPQMKNKVISLVTPLLRRMVTNERQRQYAMETRKSTAPGTGKAANKKATRDAPETPPITKESPSRYPDIDPKLDQYHYNLDPAFNSTTTDDFSAPLPDRPHLQNDVSVSREHFPESPPPPDPPIQYYINILHNNIRMRPKLILSPSSCPGFSSLVQHVRGALNDENADPVRVQILSPDGLRDVGDEEAWLDAVKSVVGNEWMDGEVKVLVEVGFRDRRHDAEVQCS